MVTLLLSAIAVLGAANQQLGASRFNHQASLRANAAFLANDIAERMRANRKQALAGDYHLKLTDDTPPGGSSAQQDLQRWLAELSRRLPEGDGAIVLENPAGSAPEVVVTLQWAASGAGGGATVMGPQRQLTYRTSL